MARFRAKALGRRAGRPRPELGAHAKRRTPLLLLLLGHRHRAAHRLREHREPAARARRRARDRDGGAAVARREPPAAARAAAHRVVRARRARRHRRPARRALDARRSIASLLPPEATDTLQFGLQRAGRALRRRRVARAPASLFGLFPALHSTRPDLVSALKAQAGQPSGARAAARFRTSLATAQIALSMALLISAGLFIKSLLNVSRVDLGVKIDNVVTLRRLAESERLRHRRDREHSSSGSKRSSARFPASPA